MMGIKHISALLALMLSWALVPAPALADDAAERTYDVIVSDEGDAALIEGATFAVDGFSRAQKGSANERDGQDIGYSYYTGSSPDAVVALVFSDGVLCYIPRSVHALCDVQDATSCAQMRAYVTSLDAAADKGSGSIPEDIPWSFTSDEVAVAHGLVITFSVDVEGRFYVGMVPADAHDAPDWTTLRPDYADILTVVEPGSVQVRAPAEGLAAFGEFLAGIDYSPLWVTLKTTGCAIVLIFVLGLADVSFVPRCLRELGCEHAGCRAHARVVGYAHLLPLDDPPHMELDRSGHGARLRARPGRIRCHALSGGQLRGHHAHDPHRHLLRMDERQHRCRHILDSGHPLVLVRGHTVHQRMGSPHYAVSEAE